MSSFLTVKEAATLTGKSPSSIRRVIYPIIRDDNHADREQIAPTVDEVTQLRMKGENFAWRISEELLRREVPVETTKPTGEDHGNSQPRTAGDAELLAMLRRELDIKNQQITQQSEMLSKQMELISGLSERLREGNILIGSLQQQLVLPEVTPKSHATKPQPTPPQGKKTKKTETTVAQSTTKKAVRKGLFSRLFGSKSKLPRK